MGKERIKSGGTSFTGNAGEYYVMAELLKRGVIAALAPRNAPSFDILATKEKLTVKIRVKTKFWKYTDWQLNAKKDGAIFRDLSKDEDFTILVDLTMETNDLKFYIVPTHQINAWVKKDFEEWVKTPGRDNRSHDSTTKKRNLSGRKHASKLSKYLNQWESLWK